MTMKLRDCPTQSNVLAYACAGILCMVATVPFPAHAGAPPVPDPVLTDNTLLASAVPDECFNGVGVDYPPINSDGTCGMCIEDADYDVFSLGRDGVESADDIGNWKTARAE